MDTSSPEHTLEAYASLYIDQEVRAEGLTRDAGRVHSADLRGLRTFRTDYPEVDSAMLYRGSERLNIDGIWCPPVEDFLQEMTPGHGLLPQVRGMPRV